MRELAVLRLEYRPIETEDDGEAVAALVCFDDNEIEISRIHAGLVLDDLTYMEWREFVEGAVSRMVENLGGSVVDMVSIPEGMVQ